MDFFNSTEILKDQILPQLLLGIKDTNDEVVAATLRTLALLVPVLGSTVVIGSNRSRIFADGKPNAPSSNWPEMRSITPIMNGAGIVSSSPMPTDTAGDVSDSFVSIINSQTTSINNNDREIMPERPDGADEGEETQLANEQADDDEAWSDWETEQNSNELQQTDPITLDTYKDSNTIPSYQRNISVSSSNSTATNQNNGSFIKDIKDIDIKPINNQINDEIDDFFKDMEPKIIAMPSSITSLLATQLPPSDENTNKDNTLSKVDRFAVTNIENDSFDDTAWGNESDWDN